ncbi:MAG: 3-methyl-2-oxobutanoate hydroxymethyltransferase [Wenzhouxiangella sp.]
MNQPIARAPDRACVPGRRMTIPEFRQRKQTGQPISMVTCYDAWSARLIAGSPIDCVLVGDSLAMVVYGHDSTLPVDIDTMAAHTAAVRRGAPEKLIVGDLPFLSYRCGRHEAVRNAGKLMQAGAEAVKLEGADGNLETIHFLVESGIPVMGHVGLTPQSVHQLGGYRVQGREPEGSDRIKAQAQALQEAGCFALVLEALPSVLGEVVSAALEIPTIGIGAGPGTDGQVLVLHDLLGFNTAFKPRFVRTWLDGASDVQGALAGFHQAVLTGDFPAEAECY